MTVLSKFSALCLFLGIAFSGPASATNDVWDSPNPWGAATLSQFAAWNVFDSTFDTTPDVVGSGAGSVQALGTASLYGSGNITNFTSSVANPLLETKLFSDTSSFYDVYLRIETYKMKIPLGDGILYYTDANANTVALGSTSVVSFIDPFTLERENYWVWTNVPGSVSYVFHVFNQSPQNNQFQQVAMATVAVPVPEPKVYGMMLIGLGLMGFMGRRRSNKR